MDVIAVILVGIRIILGFFLLLFVPGFVISLVFFPRPTELHHIERLVYSMVLSIGSVILIILFMDFVLGMNTTPGNISIIICAFSIFALLVWQCEKKYGNSTLKLISLIYFDYNKIQSYVIKLKDFIRDRIRIKKRIIYKKDL